MRRQLVYGPISDRYGRKPPLYVGFALYALGSLGCALSTSMSMLVVMRVVQALGGCAGLVISRAIVAPWAGSDARFGTNPVTVGIPLPGEPPFILDMATSAVAQGKIRVAHNKRAKIPLGKSKASVG